VIFYNGFNLLVDLILVVISCRIAYRFGFGAGYGEREREIEYQQGEWQDYYYEQQREMRD
jgi:hypothetical protein